MGGGRGEEVEVNGNFILHERANEFFGLLFMYSAHIY